ncbi:hypothetical protein RRF57_004260 [Xylaria bambusicola]|uniref:Uncharacterized protein n=1 Tax=Xylaria bambusicola TaxID=326684 RepID=A0AAN7U9Y0_9PEZI
MDEREEDTAIYTADLTCLRIPSTYLPYWIPGRSSGAERNKLNTLTKYDQLMVMMIDGDDD